jgi:LytS/YehU family sensor histidine kinase
MNLHLYNISPGRYDVAIKYKYLQQSVLKTTFIIHPPWWQTWWFYFLAASLTIIILTWIYRWHIHNVRTEEAEKKQLKQRIAEIEMTALRSQMNPHFIFNCLNSINRFILTNDTDAASDYLTKFSRLIRLILDGSRSDFVTLSVEMEALRLYIEMEAMRFQSSFEWEINVDPSINANDILLPALLLQPFVENAIWHGLIQSPSEKVKRLQITVEQINHGCQIIIQDNGIGRQSAMMIKSKSGDQHKSHGISLSNERLQLMDKIHNTQSTIKIDDLYTPDGLQCLGTKVTIILKNISYDSSDH